MNFSESPFWKKAIDSETKFIMENNTWILNDLPPECKHVGCKWIFKKKFIPDDAVDKYKAELVAKDYA